MDAQFAHKLFRTLVRKDVSSLLMTPKEVWSRKWKCRCYESFEEFCALFPTDEKREQLLIELREQEAESAKLEREVGEAFVSVYGITYEGLQDKVQNKALGYNNSSNNIPYQSHFTKPSQN